MYLNCFCFFSIVSAICQRKYIGKLDSLDGCISCRARNASLGQKQNKMSQQFLRPPPLRRGPRQLQQLLRGGLLKNRHMILHGCKCTLISVMNLFKGIVDDCLSIMYGLCLLLLCFLLLDCVCFDRCIFVDIYSMSVCSFRL